MSAGTSVDVDAFPVVIEYSEDAPEFRESARLVVDGLTSFASPAAPVPNLFGEGNGFSNGSLFDLSFGFENSFIFDFCSLSLGSLSGNGSKPLKPGDVLPGYAADAAVAAAAALVPVFAVYGLDPAGGGPFGL